MNEVVAVSALVVAGTNNLGLFTLKFLSQNALSVTQH
jgi:hypothetical protein